MKRYSNTYYYITGCNLRIHKTILNKTEGVYINEKEKNKDRKQIRKKTHIIRNIKLNYKHVHVNIYTKSSLHIFSIYLKVINKLLPIY